MQNAVWASIIFSIAGSLWLVFGAYLLNILAISVVLVLAGCGLVWAILSIRAKTDDVASAPVSAEEQKRNDWASRRFNMVNIAQGVAIFLAVQVWNNLHAAEYLAPTIAVIVGLHFIALAPAFSPAGSYSKPHLAAGIAMCVIAVVTVVAAPKHSASGLYLWGVILGFANGALLWGNAAARLRFAGRSQRR